MNTTAANNPLWDGLHPPACVCPLSRVVAGTPVRIKRLSATPDVNHRLREMGFCEEQQVKLVSREPMLICLVCNTRLGLSKELGENIFVEPLTIQRRSQN